MHSDDSILGRFRPSHAGSHHHSMGGKGPQVHEFVGLYSDPQCDAGTITAVVTLCVLQIEPTSEQVSQIVLYKFRRQCYKFRRQCYDGVGNTSGQRTCVAKTAATRYVVIELISPNECHRTMTSSREPCTG